MTLRASAAFELAGESAKAVRVVVDLPKKIPFGIRVLCRGYDAKGRGSRHLRSG